MNLHKLAGLAAIVASAAIVILTVMGISNAFGQTPNPSYQIVVSYCWEGVPNEADGCDMTVRPEVFNSQQRCEQAAHNIVQQFGAFFQREYPTARLFVEYGCVASYDT